VNLADVQLGQAVLWRNAAGRLVCATVVAIDSAHDTVVITVARSRTQRQEFRIDPATLLSAGDTVMWHGRAARITAVLLTQNAVDIAIDADDRARRVAARSLAPTE